MKIPYGISNFEKLVTEDYYFVDKTRYIEQLECKDEPYIIFLRPGRFGKSLFVSMLEYYYGLEHKNKFDTLFGKYYIGQNPTPKANSFHVLSFDFSGIDTSTPERRFEGFLENVRSGTERFIDQYPNPRISEDRKKDILSKPGPNMTVMALFNAYKDCKICLLIDDYDSFDNHIPDFDCHNYSNLADQNKFAGKFYEAVKSATSKGVVDRLFITGITPAILTMGGNYAVNISLNKDFSEMMGFTEEETEHMLRMTLQNRTSGEIREIMGYIRTWYDGYLFSKRAQRRVYNPDMALHFLREYMCENLYPDELTDVNIASAYIKIRNLFASEKEFCNYEVLYRLIETGEMNACLTSLSRSGQEFAHDDFVSLMFCLGLVTIRSELTGSLTFSIPNNIIKELYRAIFTDFLKTRNLQFEAEDVREAMRELSMNNHIHPFISIIEKALGTLSDCDFCEFDEKYVKTLFIVFASLARMYFIKSEPERKYPEVMFLYRPPFFPDHQFVFELKYLKKQDESLLKKITAQAEAQLKRYLLSEEIRGLKNLKAYVLIFVEERAVVVKEMGKEK